jgi:hypothetical protein
VLPDCYSVCELSLTTFNKLNKLIEEQKLNKENDNQNGMSDIIVKHLYTPTQTSFKDKKYQDTNQIGSRINKKFFKTLFYKQITYNKL